MVSLGKNGQKWYWMNVCVWGCFLHTAQNHVCLIITPQSFLAFPSNSVPPSYARPLVKGSVPNKAHSHARRMWGSTEPFQLTTTITSGSLSFTVSSTLCYPLSSTLFSPKHPQPCFATFCIKHPCLSLFIYISLSHTICLCLLWYPIRASCLLLHPEAEMV